MPPTLSDISAARQEPGCAIQSAQPRISLAFLGKDNPELWSGEDERRPCYTPSSSNIPSHPPQSVCHVWGAEARRRARWTAPQAAKQSRRCNVNLEQQRTTRRATDSWESGGNRRLHTGCDAESGSSFGGGGSARGGASAAPTCLDTQVLSSKAQWVRISQG